MNINNDVIELVKLLETFQHLIYIFLLAISLLSKTSLIIAGLIGCIFAFVALFE